MAKVMLMDNGLLLDEIHISAEKTCIGRGSINQIQLEDPSISRFHAEIHRQGLLYTLTDKRSTNGTLLNEVPIEQSRELSDYDEIAIGSYKLIFVLESVDQPKAVTPQSLDPAETLLELSSEA